LLIAFRADPAGTRAPDGANLAAALRYGVDDLKTWYPAAALARPGPVPGLRMADRVYGETAFGRLLLDLRAVCDAHPDPGVQQFGEVRLVPTHQRHRLG
jgi:hypothetical protein